MRKFLLPLILGLLVAAVPAVAMATRQDRSAPGSAPNAGPITRFTADVLTIKLTDGSTVSGRVTTDTEIRCAAGRRGEVDNAEHGQSRSWGSGVRR